MTHLFRPDQCGDEKSFWTGKDGVRGQGTGGNPKCPHLRAVGRHTGCLCRIEPHLRSTQPPSSSGSAPATGPQGLSCEPAAAGAETTGLCFPETVMTTPQPCLLPSDSAETLCHPCPLLLEDQRPRAQQPSSSLPLPTQCASESHTPPHPLQWDLGQTPRKGSLQRNILLELRRCSVSEALATQACRPDFGYPAPTWQHVPVVTGLGRQRQENS